MSEQPGTTTTEAPGGEGAHHQDAGGGWNARGPRLSLHAIGDAVCDIHRQAEEVVMQLLPPAVSEHLINSQKEVVLAGRRLADIALERLDEKAARVRR